ncbi:MAG: pitrilysin family protein [Hydrogenothermaceae bacterium]
MERVYINDTKFILKETKGLGIISGSIYILGGSIEDPEGKKGLTNLTTKLLLKGSKNYDSYIINKFFEDSGGFISSTTTDEYSVIEFSLKVEDFEKAIEIINDILKNPVFDKEKLKIEIENTKAQIRAKKESGISFAIEKLREVTFKGTPYETSSLGKEEDLDSITVDDIKSRWNELYNSSRFVISIVGDIPLKEMKESLKKLKIENKREYKPPLIDISIKNSDCHIFKRDGAQSTILLMFNAPKVSKDEYFSFKILNSILGDGFTSKLFQELREKKGYAYAVGSFYSPKPSFGYMVAYIGTAPEKTEDAIKDMRNVIYNFDKEVTEEDLKIAKEKIVGTFLMNHQTRLKQANYLGMFEVIGLGYEYDEKFPQIINSVTLNEVIEVYKKYIPAGSACVIVEP